MGMLMVLSQYSTGQSEYQPKAQEILTTPNNRRPKKSSTLTQQFVIALTNKNSAANHSGDGFHEKFKLLKRNIVIIKFKISGISIDLFQCNGNLTLQLLILIECLNTRTSKRTENPNTLL